MIDNQHLTWLAELAVGLDMLGELDKDFRIRLIAKDVRQELRRLKEQAEAERAA